MKTTTATKKEYRQPQIVAMGDALETTLAGLPVGVPDGGTIIFLDHWFWPF